MRWLTALLLWLAAALACAQELQQVPALSARVIDQTATLDATQRQGLEDKLAAYESASGPVRTSDSSGTLASRSACAPTAAMSSASMNATRPSPVAV